jgi:hypothetical protein
MTTNQERRDRSFRAVVAYVGEHVGIHLLPGSMEKIDIDRFARALLDELHARGLAIHDPANCLRKPWQERGRDSGVQPIETMGRAMTSDEMIMVGLLAVGDALDTFDDVPEDV